MKKMFDKKDFLCGASRGGVLDDGQDFRLWWVVTTKGGGAANR